MIDRHRSLIHMLMAGLVGLTLGLFIGWWVWPVQWIEAPATAPATAPAASAPAQSVESPAEENTRSDSNYSAFLNWVNQGLLYVAAVLLLVGGVVIGYQLLRQSQGKNSTQQPFPLPFSRSRSNQATAPREPRAQSPPLAGRPVRQRQPGLNWLRRETPPERPANAEEPVFTEQTVARPPDELSPHSPFPGGETSQGAIPGAEAKIPSIQQDDTLPPEDWTDQSADGSVAPPERSDEGERGPGSPVSYGVPGVPVPAVQGTEDDQDGESNVDRIGEDLTQLEHSADEEADQKGDVLQSGVELTVSESEGFAESRNSEEEEHWEENWLSESPEATFSEVLEDPKEAAGAIVDTVENSGEFAGPDGPVEREERGMESYPIPRLEPAIEEPVSAQGEAAPAAHPSQQMVGRFEANYAFGIQTYDESFTINAADGELLGACGMGINESVDRAAADLDQVRLLDIWLYDRSAVRSVSQPLVSPGFDASGLEDHTDGSGSDSSPPLEVTSGLTCTLRSDNIVLECKINSVTYLDSEQTPMPFRSVSASIAVYVQS